jgi:hypothetical protein
MLINSRKNSTAFRRATPRSEKCDVRGKKFRSWRRNCRLQRRWEKDSKLNSVFSFETNFIIWSAFKYFDFWNDFFLHFCLRLKQKWSNVISDVCIHNFMFLDCKREKCDIKLLNIIKKKTRVDIGCK